MEKIGKEIRRRRNSLGLTIEQLVDRIERLGGKANQGNLSRIELDKQGCSMETLSYIARALECKVSDLYLGAEGFANVSAVTNRLIKKVPIINNIQAGNLERVFDQGQNEFTEWITTEKDCGRNTFALRIKGNSMEDRFKEGDLVIIDPNIKPRPGDFVAAINHEDGATFKKFRPRGINEKGEDVFELVPLNEDYPSIRSDIVPMRIIGTMIEHRNYRK